VTASESTNFDALHDFLPDFIEQSDWEVQELLDRADAAIQQIRSRPELDSAPGTGADLEDRGANEAAWSGFGHVPESLRAHKQPSSSLPWLVLGIGLAVFVCGGILTAWALLGLRPELWPIGISLLVAGQMVILVVVIWQFDGFGMRTRQRFGCSTGLMIACTRSGRQLATGNTSDSNRVNWHLGSGPMGPIPPRTQSSTGWP